MKTKIILACLFSLSFLSFNLLQDNKPLGDDTKETGIFKVDMKNKTIISPAGNVNSYLKLQYISVTTDQPVYWPDEDVFLQIAFPLYPNEEIAINLQKKDASPNDIGKFELNESGLLVKKILSGKDKKIEAGEYKIEVRIPKKKVESVTTFSVVEGSLGAVSFGYEFEQITNSAKLNEVKGGWFLGNAGGVGKRWGNGLNVKNEVRVLNKPFTGEVTVKTRCYLPGCNGVEAGHQIQTTIENGKLEAVLDIGGHSGPFEVEVITPKGNVRNLFSKSGHVERQTIPITNNMTNTFNMTLAPYEGTKPVYGKQLFIEKMKETHDDAIELRDPVPNSSKRIELVVKKEISNAKLFLYYAEKDDKYEMKEIKLSKNLEKGETINVECYAPGTFITIGGFINDKKDFYEGWVIALTPSEMDIDIQTPAKGSPLKPVEIVINTTDHETKKGISTYGFLEVFDNRVPSKSALDPLISSLGDSYRGLSNYLTTWRDMTGLAKDEEMVRYDKAVSPSAGGNKMKTARMPSLSSVTNAKLASNAPSISSGSNVSENYKPEEVLEAIREGEKKVVFCDLIKTDKNGKAMVSVDLPPQTGRCKVRFTAIHNYEYAEKTNDIDVEKGNFVEMVVQPMLLPDARVQVNAYVKNKENEDLALELTGAGLKEDMTKKILPGDNEITFELTGHKYGNLMLILKDKNGNIKDRRQVEIKDMSSLPTTFSEVLISEGKAINIEKGRKIAIYSNPARMMKGMLMDIVTTMYSWFGHSEALTAACAVRGMLLRAIDDKIIDDEGLRETIKSDLIKTVKDLNEVFFDASKGSMRPYPGVMDSPLWSLWAYKNLNTMIESLKGNGNLKKEFSATLDIADNMAGKIKDQLIKNKISFEEESFTNRDGVDVIPIEIDGKTVYKLISDDAVVNWFVKKMKPIIDNPNIKNTDDMNKALIKQYDVYRFLKAFERTGNIYYLLLNAKSMLLKGDENFYSLFNKIAKGMIATQDPGMIKGPALLGGVYSAPQTFVKFLEVLIEMANKKMIARSTDIEITEAGKKKGFTLKDEPLILDANQNIKISASKFVCFRIDKKQDLNVYSFLEKKPFFDIITSGKDLTIGSETELIINLDNDRDPNEYYAVIAAPSVLSIRQTEDLLSDYKGQLLYGQKSAGGERIQMLTLPFRGSRQMILKLEGALKGSSEGYVMVRHMNNPDVIATGKIPIQNVK
jgi:hypothetical protein